MALNDGLSGFSLQVSNVLIENEVGTVDPYVLRYVSAGGSFSFGGLQWDLPNHTPLDGAREALEIFEDVLATAVYPAGSVNG